jgi:hypothetical protein
MGKRSFFASSAQSSTAPDALPPATPARPSLVVVDAAEVFKKRPEFSLIDEVTRKPVETVWQVKSGRYYIEKGTDKASKRSEYMGELSCSNGIFTFSVSMATQVNPMAGWRVVRSHSYYEVVQLAYACRRGMKINGKPVLGEVK